MFGGAHLLVEHACLECLAANEDTQPKGYVGLHWGRAGVPHVGNVADDVPLDGRAFGVVHRVGALVGNAGLAREPTVAPAADRLTRRRSLQIEATRDTTVVGSALPTSATRDRRD